MTTESNLSEIKYKDEVSRPYASLHTPLWLEAYFYAFLILALDGGDRSASRQFLLPYTRRKSLCTY
jgi:hypothetical protein